MKACDSDAPPKLKRFILSQVQKMPMHSQPPPNTNGPPFKKSKWTPEEDQLLIESVNKNGMGNWSLVCLTVPGRSGKQCRERWINQLCPELNKHSWDPQEDAILIQQHHIYGNFWTKIAQFLPGRSANNIKNRWSWLSRHLVQQNLFSQNISMLLLPHKGSDQFNKFQQNPQPLCIAPGPNPVLAPNSQICRKPLLPSIIYPIQNQNLVQQPEPQLGYQFEPLPIQKASATELHKDNLPNLVTDIQIQKIATRPELEIKINLPKKCVEDEKT